VLHTDAEHVAACAHLDAEHVAHELFVVDVALTVLSTHQQLLHLVIVELLAQVSEQVPQLGGGDVAVAVLVEVSEALDEVVGGVAGAVARDAVQDGQEHLEGDALLRSVLLGELFYIGFSGVLSEGAKNFADLENLNFVVTFVVKDAERLLEINLRHGI